MVFLGLIFNLCRDGYYKITGKDKKVSDLSSFKSHKNVIQNIIYEFENLKRCLKAYSKVAQEKVTFAQFQCLVCSSTKREIKDRFLSAERPTSGSDNDDCWYPRRNSSNLQTCETGCYHLYYAYRLKSVGERRSRIEYTTVERGCRYFKNDQRGQKYLFPTSGECDYNRNFDGCPIELDSLNYGNHGSIQAKGLK
ncbi:unnamed protein product [Oikopleura dioica]|uniref:Uncharacterized protein n=1 Tax=Oikopleura dioica TaxID=34765 RepID=E4XNW8_OIKDI|nr:unnamed protein product [Oikopleura dioica]